MIRARKSRSLYSHSLVVITISLFTLMPLCGTISSRLIWSSSSPGKDFFLSGLDRFSRPPLTCTSWPHLACCDNAHAGLGGGPDGGVDVVPCHVEGGEAGEHKEADYADDAGAEGRLWSAGHCKLGRDNTQACAHEDTGEDAILRGRSA